MAAFVYEALDGRGMDQQGIVEAVDEQSATQLLRDRMLYVKDIRRKEQKQANASEDVMAWLDANRSLPLSALILFFKQLSVMLRNGLTLLSALETASETSTSGRLRRAVLKLRDDVQSGASLSEAMRRQPNAFSPLIAQLVSGAETSGELDLVMTRIAEDLSRKQELRRQLVASLTYPGIVFLTSIGVAAFLMLKVVPVFATFFAKTGRPMPPLTEALVNFSSFAQQVAPFLAVALLVTAVLASIAWRHPDTRPRMDAALLRMPVIGSLLRTGNIARFSWTAALLLRSGVTLVETLGVCRRAITNVAIANDIEEAAEQVLRGRSLAESLKRPTLPPLVWQLTQVGERTGALDTVFQEIGDYYQVMLAAALKRLTTLIEPVLILVVGGMVGFVYFAFFQALFAVAG